MKLIDVQNFKKYYKKIDSNAGPAKIGHVNQVIENVNQDFNGTFIDPSITGLLNSGVFTDFSKNNLKQINGIGPDNYPTYNLDAFFFLNEPAEDTYIVYLGSIKGDVNVSGVKGSITGTNVLFGTANYEYAYGAQVNDSAGPGTYIVLEASVLNLYNPFDDTYEIYALIYTDTGETFQTEVQLSVEIIAQGEASYSIL